MHGKGKAIEEGGDTHYTCGGDVIEIALIKVTPYTKVPGAAAPHE